MAHDKKRIITVLLICGAILVLFLPFPRDKEPAFSKESLRLQDSYVVTDKMIIEDPIVISFSDSIFYLSSEKVVFNDVEPVFDTTVMIRFFPFSLPSIEEGLVNSRHFKRYWKMVFDYWEDNMEALYQNEEKGVKVSRFIRRPQSFILILAKQIQGETVSTGGTCTLIDCVYTNSFFPCCHPVYSRKDVNYLKKNDEARSLECKSNPNLCPPGLSKHLRNQP